MCGLLSCGAGDGKSQPELAAMRLLPVRPQHPRSICGFLSGCAPWDRQDAKESLKEEWCGSRVRLVGQVSSSWLCKGGKGVAKGRSGVWVHTVVWRCLKTVREQKPHERGHMHRPQASYTKVKPGTVLVNSVVAKYLIKPTEGHEKLLWLTV